MTVYQMRLNNAATGLKDEYMGSEPNLEDCLWQSYYLLKVESHPCDEISIYADGNFLIKLSKQP